MFFEWDENKNKLNLQRHHISFEDARYVFADPLAVTRQDYHELEHRWQILGHVGEELIILAVYTLRLHGDEPVIRIISARKATRQERRSYEEGTWV